MSLQGGKIAGGNPETKRADLDYYATNPVAVEMLLNNHHFNSRQTILEPCVGGGHIANYISSIYRSSDITGIDLAYRGYKDTIVADYLTYETDKKYDLIITNPPFSQAQEFIEKSIDLINDSGSVAMFLKLNFLEGVKRKEFFEKHPPKYIYVFRKRMATWKNGNPINPETNKKWSETICFAWFIWEKNSKTEPIIRWL